MKGFTGKTYIGRVFSGYRITGMLGEGRYGICFSAEDSKGRRVVLKRFKPKMLSKNREKNHYEAVILSKLNHPAIPEFLGVIKEEKQYFFILEYMPAKPLEQWLFSRHKRFSSQEIIDAGLQLIGIMEYLEENGIVHRDITIANVLYDGERIYLIDFGLARFADGRYMMNIDYSYLGDLLLHLIYSSYEGACSIKKPWYEELDLQASQTAFLKKLLGSETGFHNAQEVKKDFILSFCRGGVIE